MQLTLNCCYRYGTKFSISIQNLDFDMFRCSFKATITVKETLVKQSMVLCCVQMDTAQDPVRWGKRSDLQTVFNWECQWETLLQPVLIYIKRFYTRTTFSQGDSGGPLTVKQNGAHTLVGITSYRLSTTDHIKVDVFKWYIEFCFLRKKK